MSKRVVVVDDEADMVEVIKAALDSDNLEVTGTTDPGEAERICQNECVDVLITDVVMKGKNGLDLIMSVKKTCPNVVVIAMSGGGGVNGNFNYLEVSRLVGAENTLEKPFSLDDIRAVVDEALH